MLPERAELLHCLRPSNGAVAISAEEVSPLPDNMGQFFYSRQVGDAASLRALNPAERIAGEA
ncbi:hypothetical protein AMC83_CH02087 [Rhizobium phaseoli]|nr:hypothetical protein AMC83_CH02087 [Rhizobium phaseoli]